MNTVASQITSLTIVYSIVCLSADKRKHQSSALLAFVRGIHRRPVNSAHKGPVTQKMFSFDDVIMMLPNPHYGNIHYIMVCVTRRDMCVKHMLHATYELIRIIIHAPSIDID